jgi:WD40 repeat protein
LLVVAKDFGRVLVFDSKGRSVVRALDTKQGIVKSVAISPDNRMVAVAGDQDNGRVVLWNVANGKRAANFDVQLPVVQELRFLSNNLLLIKENGQPIYVVDLSDGHRVFQVEHEGWATFSGDGHLLITTSGDFFVVRSTADFAVVNKFPRPSKNAFPAALSGRRNMLIAEDTFDKAGFVTMRLSDGTAMPYKPLGKELAADPSAGYFVGIDDETGIVYGHSQARLWAWDPVAGMVCSTGVTYSEAGALSEDGKAVASGLDNGFFSGKKDPTGAEIWSTSRVLQACGFSASQAAN